MTDLQLDKIESALRVKLPVGYRRFMTEHGGALDAAREELTMEVVLLADAKQIVALNRELRKHGIETEGEPAPWPIEYLALSDNGAGDHECIKLTDAAADTVALYQFDGEEGSFARKHKSLDDYLAKLKKRVGPKRKGPAARNDPKLRAAVSISGTSRALDFSVKGIDPPATPAKLRKRGADLDRLQAEVRRMLEAVTGVDAASWTTRLGRGEYPPHVRCTYATADGSRPPMPLSVFTLFDGALGISQVLGDPTPKQRLKPPVRWDALHDAVRGMHEALLGQPLMMTPGAVKIDIDKDGWGRYQCRYTIAGA